MKALITGILLMCFSVIYAQQLPVISFKQLQTLQQQNPRPIIIKIYTNWCGICKIQDKQIAKSPELVTMLKNSFYYIELNAEGKDVITFNQEKYTFIPHGLTGGVHALAAQLNPAGTYPAWVLLSSDYKVLWQYNGIIKPNDLIKMLQDN